MKKEEFIKGQYYYMWYNNERSWILQFEEFDNNYLRMTQGISPSDKSRGSKGGWGNFQDIRQARPATSEEINQLHACAEAGKYVPAESQSYQIY